MGEATNMMVELSPINVMQIKVGQIRSLQAENDTVKLIDPTRLDLCTTNTIERVCHD